MEEANKDQKHDCGDCYGHHGCCGCGHSHKFFVLRIILALLILGVVFGLGVKVGEFKGELSGGYWGGDYYRHGMMYKYMIPLPGYSTNPATTTAPKTTAPQK